MLPGYQDIVLNSHINYFYNPFGGIDDEDILDIIEPKYSIEQWIQLLNNEKPIIIEFVGKKGRGKTTHLNALYSYFVDNNIYFLDRIDKKIGRNESPILFIDSIEKIPFTQRLLLWSKKKRSYVITTHQSKRKEYQIARRDYRSYVFEGINLKEIKKIICNRIDLASDIHPNKLKLNDDAMARLIHHFSDDFRGMLNYLYDSFKKAQSEYH